MKTPPTRDEITTAATKVQNAVRKCLAAAYVGDRAAAYMRAEEAQHAAFDLKVMFGLELDEITDSHGSTVGEEGT